MKEYNHSKIEKRWQKEWETKKSFQAKNKGNPSSRAKHATGQRKFYGLIEFPYPSGEGLHVGHVRSNTAMDVISRKRRMEGFNVLYPIGWDAFGLPTENYAIKTGKSPEKVTKENTDTFRRQLKSIGFSFDWSREVNTTDPKYYKWTQWIFLQMLKKNLAYKAKININWCPKDKIGLANEEVINGCCERCGTQVEKREKEQWMLGITKYAERLDKDLDDVDYLPQIKTQQRNWIGRSEGAEIEFKVVSSQHLVSREIQNTEKIKVFTTRPDTIFGATYVVISPEHELILNLKFKILNWEEVEKYINDAKKKAEMDRTAEGKEKTGVELKGLKAINPANNEEIPVFIADYVLATYGTGAVMAVPAHDKRDFEFAKKYNLPIKQVVYKIDSPIKSFLMGATKITDEDLLDIGVIISEKDKDGDRKIVIPRDKINEYEKIIIKKLDNGFWNEYLSDEIVFIFKHKDGKIERIILSEKTEDRIDKLAAEFVGESWSKSCVWKWVAENSFYTDSIIHEEIGKMINSGKFDGRNSDDVKKEITEFVGGKWVTRFKLRDWVFSRQRYWGEPIPVVHCEKCGVVPLPEKDLPLKLPKVKKYEPTDNGESPLASITSWVNTKCPKCKGKAKRETDTMPNWAGSSWYYLRYTDPKNDKKFADPKNLKYFTPVDWYNGGMEHTTLHLLYSRFWHKFLYDLKLVPTKEPYKKRTSHGMINAEGGEKMSKSKGNVINPDSIVKTYGADTLRVYEMFMGPFDQSIAWDTNSISGSRRFIERVWRLQNKITPAKISNTTVGKVESLLHKTILKVTEDIEAMRFNTAVSAMMILVNEFEKEEQILKKHYELLITILSPFAPHITEEIWQTLGNKTLLSLQKWPKADLKKITETKINLVIQINGKVRSQLEIVKGLEEEVVVSLVKNIPDVDKWLVGKEIIKIIYIPDRLLNFVI